MAATSIRESQAMVEWAKVFPRQVTETYTSSVNFVKQLTIVAVSTITYLKNVFPDDNYTEDQFGGLKIKVLKNKCEDELAQFLMTGLTQAFDAFDKKYLHQMALCFYEETCTADNLLEYHVFEYLYNAEGANLRVRSMSKGGKMEVNGGDAATYSMEAIRQRTLQLLKACTVMSAQTSLPDSYDVSLRLYYNDSTPESYQAPGFCTARMDENDGLLDTVDCRVKLGGVRTPFHEIHMHSYLRERDAELASCEPQVSQTSTSHRDQLENSEPLESGGGTVRCECALTDRPAYTALIVCRVCGFRQHAACYGLRRRGGASADVPLTRHCCIACAERTGQRTDQELAQASNRKCLAIFRRAVWWLAAGETGGVQAVCVRTLADAIGLNVTSATKLFKVLRAQHILATDPPNETTPVNVETDNLDAVLDRYLKYGKEILEKDVPERLVEESLSQRSNRDPLAEVLSPMERVSLKAASRIDVMSAVAPKPVAADPAIDQYRLVFTDTAESLPLPPPPKVKSPRKRKADRPRTQVKSKKVRRVSRD